MPIVLQIVGYEFAVISLLMNRITNSDELRVGVFACEDVFLIANNSVNYYYNYYYCYAWNNM